jgi:uncharacterized protein YfaS (alpha-2-macroglobulin family)
MIQKRTLGGFIIIFLLLIVGGSFAFFGKSRIKELEQKLFPMMENTQLQETENTSSVISIFPSGTIDNLEQTVIVSFSKPMVPLKILEQQADCPIQISPATKGVCRWISTQTVEFTPEKWNPSTKYEIMVKEGEQILSGTFATPLLQWKALCQDSLGQGIQLIFNFPVHSDQLKQYLQVKNMKTDKIIPVEVLETVTPGIYTLKPTAWAREYLTTYEFSLSNPLDAQNGNIPTKLTPLSYTTTDAILNVDVLIKVWTWYQRTYYNPWYSVVDNDSYYTISEAYTTTSSTQNLLPNKNVVFDVLFDEEVELLPDVIRVKQGSTLIKYSLSYVKETIYNPEQRRNEELLTKKKVRINIENITLKPATNYNIEYAPTGNTVVSTHTFKTADTLKISRIVPINYSKICLYTNNILWERDQWFTQEVWNAMITISPEAKIRSIETSDMIPYEYMPYDGYSTIKKSEVEWLIAKYSLCPLPKDNEIAYVVNTRLNPLTSYKLNFDLRDIYGNKAPKIEKEFTTEKIQDKDKFIYIGHPEINTIPSNLPLVFNVQTINIAQAVIDVCVMTIEEYVKGNSASCIQSKTKTLPIKNKNWILTNTKLDVEQDILGETAKGQIIRISGHFPTQDLVAKQRRFSTLFIRANLSLVVEAGTNKQLIFATDLSWVIMSWLSFKGYVRDWSSAWNRYTETEIPVIYNTKQWVYEFKDTADIIVASKWNHRGIINAATDRQDNYDFGYIAGNNSAEREFLYVYTERPIYKPGDTIFFKWLLRNFNFDGFAKAKSLSGSLVVFNEEGIEVTSIPVQLDKNSNFDGSFKLSKEMPLGMYMLRFKKSYDEYLETNAVFYVEEYKKPVFKIEVESGSKDSIIGNTIAIGLEPMYYFGGKITNTKGNYVLISQKYFFDAKDYSQYQFGEGYDYINCIYRNDCSYQDRAIPSNESNFLVGKEGKYNFSYKIPNEISEAEQLYSFAFEIYDPTTNMPVSKSVTKVIHATDGYVGIQVPYRNTKDQGILLKAVTLDWDAQAKPNAQVSLRLIKQDWKSLKKQWVDGVFYNDYSLIETEEYNQIYKTDDKWLLEKIIPVQGEGEYKVVVSYLGKSGKPFSSSQILYVSGDEPLLWRTENNSVTKVIAEKTMVDVGEIAKYTIQSPINTGTIFMTIEKDDGILEYTTLPLTGYATTISLPIKKEYYPNIYVKVFLIGSQANNPLPVYKKGLAISKVNTIDQKLNIFISTDKKIYQPGEQPKVTVKVTDSKNNPVGNVNLSVGIVDQSLLALKGNPQKNPFAYFYDMKRYLGVDTWISLATLVEKLEIKDTSDGSKGWDGGSLKGGNSKKKRGVFKDTAYRNANITTNVQWIAEITADKLPDNLTTWVIEVLGNTPDTKLGVQTTTIQSNLPIMINPNLPLVFGVGDKITLRPVIFNRTDQEQKIEFSFSGSYLKVVSPIQKISIPAQGSATLRVDAEVLADAQYTSQLASKIEMQAKTTNKDLYDVVQLFVPLTHTTTKETITTVGSISGMLAQERLDLPKDLQWELNLIYSKSLFGSLLDGISLSLLGEYACLEQKFSSFMPHVYTKLLYIATEQWSSYDFEKIMLKQREDSFDGYQEISLHTYIKQQLDSLEKFQNTDGWFTFRYDTVYDKQSSVWLTNYIVSSLSYLKKLDYKPSEKITDKAVKYLKAQRYSLHKDSYRDKEMLLQILSALIDWNPKDWEIATMRELLQPSFQETKSLQSKLHQALFLGKLSEQKESYKKVLNALLSDIIKEDLVMNPRTAYIGKKSTERMVGNTAIFIEAMSFSSEFREKYPAIADALQRRIVSQKKNGLWGSTQDTVNVIRGVSSMVSHTEIIPEEVKIATDIANKSLEQSILKKGDPFAIATIKTSLSEIAHTADLTMRSNTNKKTYYDIGISYFLPAKTIEARYEWFVIKKNYYSYEEYSTIKNQKDAEQHKYRQGEISYAQLKYPKEISTYLTPKTTASVGDVLVTIMTIVINEPRKQVAIENFIPAGSEVINYTLSTESKYAQQNQKQERYDEYYEYTPEPYENKWELICDKQEFRPDRFFCYKENVDPGSYTLVSLIRMTHAGIFAIKPSTIFEFYAPENFGRTKGEEIQIK